MPRTNAIIQGFNRGQISPLALARTDLDRTRLSAEEQRNWVPRILGSMSLRPGLEYISSTNSNGDAFFIPFVFSIEDTALIELTDNAMRVLVDETPVTRVSVSTSVTNGSFATDLSGWTDNDQTGSTSAWVAGGYLGLTGTKYNAAVRAQALTIAPADQGQEHAIRVVVARGHVTLKVGTTSGDDDVMSSAALLPGTHSLAFTPNGATVYVELSSMTQYASLVDSVAIEGPGEMTIPTIWPVESLTRLRTTQSADVLFCANKGFKPQRIERRSTTSWSVVDYLSEDGPFDTENTSAITLTAGALIGDTTLTASQKYFKSSNVGSIFRLSSVGQTVQASLTAGGQFSDPIRVTGVATDRNFSIVRSGTWAGKLTVERSIGDVGAWVSTTTTYTANGTITYNDALDNQIIYYRIGFETGDYTSGTANVTLTFDSGSITGIAKVTGYTSPTSVDVSILSPMGNTLATEIWNEGQWSNRRGYPSAVALYEGRLWWAGKDKIWGSISDAFDSFDPDVEGDSGVINRSIGEGPLEDIAWLLPLQRMLVGGQAAELSIRSSSFDELITPANFNIKTSSTQGSAPVAAVKLDYGGLFVQEGGTRLFQLSYNSDTYDYNSSDLTVLIPEINMAGIVKIAVQRKPDTRVHCVLADGTVALLIFDKTEDVTCWLKITTDGLIKDVVILPGEEGDGEDKVYYTVDRTAAVGGVASVYLEKWALESETIGGLLNKQADSFSIYDGAPISVIPGLSHLNPVGASAATEVVVWADGRDLGTFSLSGDTLDLGQAVSKAVIGLWYDAPYKSTKLAYGAAGGTAITMKKKVPQIGLVMQNTHRYGLQYGGDMNHLDDLPAYEDEELLDENKVWDHYDKEQMSFNGDWDTDSRVFLYAQAPRPVTVLALVMTVETNG